LTHPPSIASVLSKYNLELGRGAQLPVVVYGEGVRAKKAG